MKLNFDETEIETSEQFKEASFSIRSMDMGVILEILRSKMYSNPIASICQEIASNARDANREVGHRKKPIKISIVNSLFRQNELDYVIEDEGPGISPERMNEIYIFYGASTKRDSNTQTGCFGLGAKLPFSYTDSFSIVTRHEGIKYTYQAVVEGNRAGRVILIHSEPTTDFNGTSIIVPIQRKDEYEFSIESYRATFFWKVKPVYSGLTDCSYTFPEIIRDDDRVIIVKNSSLYEKQGYYALIDEIPYFLDLNLLGFAPLANYSMLFKFKTGSLSIAASREAVHYDEATIKHLRDRYNAYVADESKILQDSLNTATCEFHAKILVAEKISGPCSEVLSKNIHWKDKIVDLQTSTIEIQEVSGKSSYQRKSLGRVPHNLLKGPLVEMDMEKFSEARNDTLLRNNNPYFYAVTPCSSYDKTTGDKKGKEFDELKSIVGNLQLYSKVEHVRKAKTSTASSTGDRVKAHRIKRNWHQIDTRCEYLKKDGVKDVVAMYVVLERIGSLKDSDARWYCFIEQITNYRFYIIRSKFLNDVKDHWKSYEEVYKQVEPKISEIRQYFFVKDLKNIHRLRKLSFNDFHQKIVSALYDLSKKVSYRETDVPPDLFSKYAISEEMKASVGNYQDIFKKYPLLDFIENGSSKYGDLGKNEVLAFNQYISLIDKEFPWTSDGSKQQVI